MNPNFEDPHNHVPEVKPEDGWGDETESGPAPQPPEKPTAKPPSSKKKKPPKKTEFEDPNNHVPEVKPDDSWGDEPIFPLKKIGPSDPAGFEDPNNHVPPVTPVDDWGDEAGSDVPVLPKRRAADEKPAGYAAPADDEKGVKIGVRVIERAEDREQRGPIQRLEIQEHVPKLQTSQPAPLPKIVPKQVIEKPEPAAGEPEEEQWIGRAPESENWGRQKPASMRWIVISGLLLAVAVIAGVLILPHTGWKNERGTRTNFSKLEVFDPPMLETKDKDSLTLEEGIEDKAKILIEAFAKATSPDQVLPLVRDRERVETALRERWKPMDVPSNWHVPDDSKWEILKAGKRDYGFLSGLLPDITPFRFYIVQQGDKALLDWEATSGYAETTFENLSKKQGEGGITRGFVSPGDLYTFSMPEKDYQCYRITSPDAQISIWGYVKRQDPVAEQLAALFLPGVIPREILSEYPVTLKLAKAPEESLKNQWIITEMLHMEWISP